MTNNNNSSWATCKTAQNGNDMNYISDMYRYCLDCDKLLRNSSGFYFTDKDLYECEKCGSKNVKMQNAIWVIEQEIGRKIL